MRVLLIFHGKPINGLPLLTSPSIIAVTGWNGKPIWSWKPEDSRHVWLRDWLGRDLAERDCAARVFTYGYPSTVARSDSDASLRDYGANLLGSLATARRSEFEVSCLVPNLQFVIGRSVSVPGISLLLTGTAVKASNLDWS